MVANGPGFLPFVLTLLWFVCASVGLVRQGGEPRRPARQAEAVAVAA